MKVDERTQARLDGLTRELDALMVDHQRHMSRSMIMEIVFQRAYQCGRDDEAKEWTANLQALLTRRESGLRLEQKGG